MYNRYSDTISNYLQKNVLPAVSQLHGITLLSTINKHWNNHKLMLKWLTKFFQYLDRFYVKMENNTLPLREKGLDLFRTVVFDPIRKKLTRAIIDEVNKNREEELVDESLLKSAIEIYIETDRNKKKLVQYEECYEVMNIELSF